MSFQVLGVAACPFEVTVLDVSKGQGLKGHGHTLRVVGSSLQVEGVEIVGDDLVIGRQVAEPPNVG